MRIAEAEVLSVLTGRASVESRRRQMQGKRAVREVASFNIESGENEEHAVAAQKQPPQTKGKGGFNTTLFPGSPLPQY